MDWDWFLHHGLGGRSCVATLNVAVQVCCVSDRSEIGFSIMDWENVRGASARVTWNNFIFDVNRYDLSIMDWDRFSPSRIGRAFACIINVKPSCVVHW